MSENQDDLPISENQPIYRHREIELFRYPDQETNLLISINHFLPKSINGITDVGESRNYLKIS